MGDLKDAQFGPRVRLGVGRVTAELEPDASFETAPLGQPRGAISQVDPNPLAVGEGGTLALDVNIIWEA